MFSTFCWANFSEEKYGLNLSKFFLSLWSFVRKFNVSTGNKIFNNLGMLVFFIK